MNGYCYVPEHGLIDACEAFANAATSAYLSQTGIKSVVLVDYDKTLIHVDSFKSIVLKFLRRSPFLFIRVFIRLTFKECQDLFIAKKFARIRLKVKYLIASSLSNAFGDKQIQDMSVELFNQQKNNRLVECLQIAKNTAGIRVIVVTNNFRLIVSPIACMLGFELVACDKFHISEILNPVRSKSCRLFDQSLNANVDSAYSFFSITDDFSADRDLLELGDSKKIYFDPNPGLFFSSSL